MRAVRLGALAGALLTSAILLTSCGPGSAERAPLAPATHLPQPGDASAQPDQDAAPQPPEEGAVFTQPFVLAGGTVTLRSAVPVDAPTDLDPGQVPALEAFGRYQAAWENIRWGVSFDASGMGERATGAQLESVESYAEQSRILERVSVGEPGELLVLAAETVDGAVVLDACAHEPGWVLITGGEETAQPPVTRPTVTVQQVDEEWLVSDIRMREDTTTCESRFS